MITGNARQPIDGLQWATNEISRLRLALALARIASPDWSDSDPEILRGIAQGALDGDK